MIIAIAGGSGSGKTTLSKLMQNSFTVQFNINAEIISMDNYYKNIKKDNFDNYDHPNAFNTDLLHHDLLEFNATGSVVQRCYNYTTKQSVLLKKIPNVDLVIFEGLYPYYEKKLEELCSMKLFLDVNENTRIRQRVLRDLKERNISVDENMQMINSFVNEMYSKYIIQQKESANRVFSNIQDVMSSIV